MSLTLNMAGGGGGGLKATDALLRVQAPANSTVTITKGTTTKTDLGHENALDPTVYDYYFIIHASQFDSVNPWTVTATDGVDTATDTIIIDAADEYDVALLYTYYLYRNGDQRTSITGGWRSYPSGTTSSFTPIAAVFDSDHVSLAFTSGGYKSCAIDTINKVDVGLFNTLHVEYTGTANYIGFGLRNSNTGYFDNTFTAVQTSKTSMTLDISQITGAYYVMFFSHGNSGGNISITKIWLE